MTIHIHALVKMCRIFWLILGCILVKFPIPSPDFCSVLLTNMFNEDSNSIPCFKYYSFIVKQNDLKLYLNFYRGGHTRAVHITMSMSLSKSPLPQPSATPTPPQSIGNIPCACNLFITYKES